MKTFYLLLIPAVVACSHRPKELSSEEKQQALENEAKTRQEATAEHIRFKIDGNPFVPTSLGYTSELKMDRSLNVPVFRLYFVDKEYQALDMVFFEEPLKGELPYTFPFKDNHTGDQNKRDWAVVSFTSGSIPGWHKVPKKDSFMKITAWNKEDRTISGEFEIFIENSEDKTQTISITEGKFTNLPYENKR